MNAIVEGRRTYIGPYGDRHEISFPHLSDKQVADKVRMLMRYDLDHESVCVLARDRIMHLSERADDLATMLKNIVDCYGVGSTPEKFCEHVREFMDEARDLLSAANTSPISEAK